MINQCAVSDRIRSSHVIEAHRQLQQISQKPAIGSGDQRNTSAPADTTVKCAGTQRQNTFCI